MSRKTVSAVIGSFLAAFALGAIEGCGSSSSSTDPTALCEQSCVKLQMCLADASASSAMAGCTTSCTSNTGSQNNTSKCTNSSQIESAYSNCLKMSDCTQFEACVLGIPPCAGGTGGTSGTGTGGTTSTGGSSGTGSGGTSGTGGTSGAAGGSGNAACAVCDKAQTCCVAAESKGIPASLCTLSAASCNAMSGTAQSTQITNCQMVLSEGVTFGVSACQ
jgi:hypothetical protein